VRDEGCLEGKDSLARATFGAKGTCSYGTWNGKGPGRRTTTIKEGIADKGLKKGQEPRQRDGCFAG